MSDALKRYLDIESEDDLTRIVFGLLELLGPTVLTDILELSDGSLSDDVQVAFHTRIDPLADRIPDVLIEDSEMTVMIEAKRGTELDLEQLRDEHDDLHQFGNEQKRLVLVSGHESKPSQLDEVDLEFVDWIGWRDVALRISRYDQDTLSETKRRLAELLRTKLEEEGYVPFAGFSDGLLEDLARIHSLTEHYHQHIARFHRDVEGRLGDRDSRRRTCGATVSPRTSIAFPQSYSSFRPICGSRTESRPPPSTVRINTTRSSRFASKLVSRPSCEWGIR